MASISKTIIERVAEEMLQHAQEMGNIVIVPNTYDIYVHSDDFKDVRSFLGPLHEKIIERLDSEISKASSKGSRGIDGVKAILNKMVGSQIVTGRKQYRRVDEQWHINFEEC